MADKAEGFSDAERAAIKQRAQELAASKGLKGAAKKARELEQCLDVIDGLEGLDRVICSRFHVLVGEEAPHLDPKTMYGFPAYAKDGKVVTFVQPASKYSTRYATVAFQEDAELDDGDIWPTSFAVLAWTDAIEANFRQLVRRAAGQA